MDGFLDHPAQSHRDQLRREILEAAVANYLKQRRSSENAEVSLKEAEETELLEELTGKGPFRLPYKTM